MVIIKASLIQRTLQFCGVADSELVARRAGGGSTVRSATAGMRAPTHCSRQIDNTLITSRPKTTPQFVF